MPEDQHRDPFDERITAALRETGDAFETDSGALVAGGRARGRRAVLRRRAGVLGGVAGVTLVGVSGAVLLPTGDSAEPRRFGVASSSSASPTPTTAPTAVRTSFTGDALLRELKERLPVGGEFSEEDARGTDHELGPYARLVYDDGDGAAAIAVGFARVDPDDEQTDALTECPDRTFTPYDDCSTSRLPDGSRLMLFQGYEFPDRRVDTKWWSADLVTPQGQHVSIAEWNSPAQKGAPISRENPPLTTAQLQEIVTADVWRGVVNAIPESPEPTQPPSSDDTPPPAASGTEIGETLAQLLPEKLDVVKRGGQDSGYAYLVVDDGRGTSLVQVNVQHGMDDVADELYASAETLPDGTLVATRKGPGDDRVAGVVMWTVDTMRPGSDGFRVVISAFNNGAAHAEPSRDTPALTVQQLREIALSPKWEEMR